jgi:hypothetical protein
MPLLLEQFVSALRLGVVQILDLQPRGSTRWLVGAALPFRNDAFKVVLADDSIEVRPCPRDVIDVPNSGLHARHDWLQPRFPFN